uniref:T9SS type A sorting domain-containing protein n=1 Tax=candidate division WOR-3 bacterium TaxID=2052148 RepID=A0A7C4XMJ9_UNCW3
MCKSLLIPLLGVLITGSFITAQTPTWVARYNGPANSYDQPAEVVVDNQGNVYVTGASWDTIGYEDYDFATVKYDSSGNEIWVARYNLNNGNDYAKAIDVDAYGNVYVAGYCMPSPSSTDLVFTVIRYDPLGNPLWIKNEYPNSGNDARAFDLTIDKNDNIIAVGDMNGRFYARKYSPDGGNVWTYYPTTRPGYAVKCVVDDSDCVYLTGPVNVNGGDFFTVKLSSTGTVLWDTMYNGYGNLSDTPSDICVDAQYNVYVTGSSDTAGVRGNDYLTIKYNQWGIPIWKAKYNGTGNRDDYAVAMAIDASGNIYVTGRSITDSTAPGNWDIVTVKYDNTGNELWVATFNGPGDSTDRPYDITVDTLGYVYITGETYVSGGVLNNFITLIYDTLGNLIWQAQYNGPANYYDYASSICLDNAGNIYVTGSSTGSGTQYDYATLKYSSPIGIAESQNKRLSRFYLQNKPNPVKHYTTIEYSLPSDAEVNLNIYDITGKKIATLIQEKQPAGHYGFVWNLNEGLYRNLPNGVYFYRLTAGDWTDTKKMVIIR